ncbi:MAG: DUF5317 family protein [Candidatus Aquicultorales bacterium]
MAVGAALGLIVGWLRGGRFARLASMEFPLWWSIIAAFFIQAAIPPLTASLGVTPLFTAYLVSFAMVAAALVVNFHKRYAPIVLMGVLMNVAVIAINKGMPYYTFLYRGNASLAPVRGLYRMADASTVAGFLGDWIALPPPYPQPAIVSPGDLVIALGIFLFVQRAMTAQDDPVPEAHV